MAETERQKVILPEYSSRDELGRASRRRTVVLSVLLAAVLALSSGGPELLPRMCIWYRLTGTDCPFCGLTRSVVAAGDLRLSRAFELHPFGPLVLVFLAAWLAVSVLRWRTGRPNAMPHRTRIFLGIAIGVAWLAWWVAERLLV